MAQLVTNVGAETISHKLPNESREKKENIGSDITRKNPKGKALIIYDSDGKTVWYSLTAEESVY